MNNIYEKKNKEDVNFPEMIMSLLKSINRNLRAKNWSPEKCFEPFYTFTQDYMYPYCSSAIKMVEKTYKPMGWVCKLDHYSVIESEGIKRYNYTWKFEKMLDLTNLPF